LAAALTASLGGCAAGGLRLATAAYPPSAREDVVDDYHGTAVADPYRWLEALDAPRTAAWVKAQNAVAEPYLAALPQRAWLQERLTQLYRYERYGLPREAGGRWFFLRNDGQQNQAALHVADQPDAPGRRLIDPDSLSGDSTVALADYEPSPDGRWLAYALSDAGSDWKTWHVRDVATGQDLPDLLRDTKFTSVSWARDGSGFYYSRYPGGDDQLQPVVHFHRLGDAQTADHRVFAVTDHPTRTPYATVTRDGRYLVISLDEGTMANGVMLMTLDGSGRIEPLFTRYDGLYGYIGTRAGPEGPQLLFTTTAGAGRGRVLAVDMARPAAERVRELVPEDAAVLERAALVGGQLFTVHLKDAHALLRRWDPASGTLQGTVTLPGLGTVTGLAGEDDSREGHVGYTDFFTPVQVLRLDPAQGTVSPLRAASVAADLSSYETRQVFYTSKDGTRVPMFLVHRRDLVRNGRNPVMLYGYGGFDISMTPAFSPAVLAWLEMGGVYAVANLRGGGEYGKAWHQAGTRDRKQNVFDDFIAAAEHLVAERITQRGGIVIRGGSNGGLLVAAVLTQRPELFGAALPDVGVLDMLRYHLASANARQWSDDYGLSENAADFRAQFAYSPLHNVQRQRCYPPTLVTTAAQDNRVVPWHSFKFAAALQAAQRCDRPTLLRVETRAGHGAGKPQWMQVEHFAEQWAFAAAALKMRTPAPAAGVQSASR
jgi:prolyl oligopeptidase